MENQETEIDTKRAGCSTLGAAPGSGAVCWIMEAAPMLSKAACIVVDESPARLKEIEGVRAVLESCPVDFTSKKLDRAKTAALLATEAVEALESYEWLTGELTAARDHLKAALSHLPNTEPSQ